MDTYNFYYRFEAFSIDEVNENEIKKYNSELISVECLKNQLSKLKLAYDNQTKDRADIIINVYPALTGVTELGVYHKIKYKLFSHKVTQQFYSIQISKGNTKGLGVYFYNTNNFDEVKKILLDFIKDYKIPDLSNWEYKFIK